MTAGSIGSPGSSGSSGSSGATRTTGAVRVAGSVRVAIVGLGAIGREVLKAVVARPTLELSGVSDPAFIGQDAGEVAGVGPLGIKVAPTLSAALAGADVALVLTLSGVAEMLPRAPRASTSSRPARISPTPTWPRPSSPSSWTRTRAPPGSPSSGPASTPAW